MGPDLNGHHGLEFMIEKLESNNWSTWKFQMKHVLIAKELWGYMDWSETEPGENASMCYLS